MEKQQANAGLDVSTEGNVKLMTKSFQHIAYTQHYKNNTATNSF